MLIFFLGELRRWSGEHMPNRVFYERSGNVKRMPSSDDLGSQLLPAHTFFPTRRPASSSSATPSQLPSRTIVFNPGLETPEEALMRLGVTGPVPDKHIEFDELCYVGSVFGDRRNVNLSETDQGPAPGPPLPLRDFPQRRRRRRYRAS
jgi:hypothetical protein